MARTRKDRLNWKRKERRRTGKKDPAKIRLHRERFLSKMRSGNFRSDRYLPIVLHCQLDVDPESQETVLVFDDEEVESVPFIVSEVSSIHYLLNAFYPEFNPEKEALALSAHVAKVKATRRTCALEEVDYEVRFCKSVIDCQYRKINQESGIAVCSR